MSNQPIPIPPNPSMTLEAFRASGQDHPDLNELDAGYASGNGPSPGRVYAGNFWIAKTTPGLAEKLGGEWWTTLDRGDYFGTLAEMEDLLWRWCEG